VPLAWRSVSVRFGILSTALINQSVLRAARASEEVEVVAVASRNRDRATAYAREHGIARAHGAYDALLADPEVDVVYISLPNSLHIPWTMRALEAGKHVLCEKPLARSAADVETAFDLAERNGLVLMEAFMYRHHPKMRRLRELVEGGAIGRLTLVRSTFSFWLRDETNVRMFPELEGGALMDIGCYCVSGSRLLAGEPERVLGEQVSAASGIDLALYGTMRFPGDVVAQFDCSFAAPVKQRLEAVGDEGALATDAPWRADWGGEMTLTRGEQVERIELPETDSYRLQLENMAVAVRGDGEPLLGRADAVGQARAIEALYRSAGSGAAVSL
jgi:xylose dehydrogenase (NAD/NADP)